MDSAPILLPSPRKSPFQAPYERELHLDNPSSDEDPYSYDPSPDEAVFDDSQDDSQDSHSPHTSDDDISEFPDTDSRAPSTIYTPHKRRSPFRHPSSVRNLQLDTTPPHLASPVKSPFHLAASPHSRNSTPRSVYSARSLPRSSRSSPSRKEKAPKVKKERPLVLLHFTLLPYKPPFPQSLLDAILPASKLADGKLLREKLNQSVVQERGVLIPHPRDDYDILEERLLEALELEQGTLTRDGHFVVPQDRGARQASRSIASIRPEADDENEENDPEDEVRTEMGDNENKHLCEDCGQAIDAVGGDRRWDIRVFAANGLMRQGAWGAAWHEMERVDVEIQPFISDEVKRELEMRLEEMELLRQADEREYAARQREEAAVREATARETFESTKMAASEGRRPSSISGDRRNEIYGDGIESKFEELHEVIDEVTSSQRREHYNTGSESRAEVPLTTLLLNYVHLSLQDRRNVAIGFLSVVTLLLAIIAAQSSLTPQPTNIASQPVHLSSAAATMPTTEALGATTISASAASILAAPSSLAASAIESVLGQADSASHLSSYIVANSTASDSAMGLSKDHAIASSFLNSIPESSDNVDISSTIETPTSRVTAVSHETASSMENDADAE